MRFLFLSCLKATGLIEKKLHFSLSFKEKLQLKVHKMMCDACTNYEKQNILIEKSIANLEFKPEDKKDIDLHEFENSILKKITKDPPNKSE